MSIWVNTVFMLTSLKTEIVRSINGPKLQLPRAEDAMAKPCLVQIFWKLIRADHKVFSESCESRNNHRYAIVVQDLPPNGSRRIRAKTRLHKKPRQACNSSWSQIENLESFTLTIPWNSAKLVKISPGVIARLHHTDRKLMDC